jgi:Uncharacterized protein conserved in bacteria
MFSKIKKLFEVEQTKDSTDMRLILAALFVKVAKIDSDYSKKEKDLIEDMLIRRFSISKEKASKIREDSEKIEESTSDTVQLTRKLKEEIPFEKRYALAIDLWSIVLADEKRTAEENSFMRLCVKLIGVSDVDSASARNNALKNLDLKRN